MTAYKTALTLGSIVLIAACVTINVYFPQAAAEQAAERFIEGVIGEDDNQSGGSESNGNEQALLMMVVDFIFPAAHAQVSIDIDTPEVKAIQNRMRQRFNQDLRQHFASGAIGLSANAMVEVRDASKLALRDRNKVKSLVAADNKDRDAVYREIAVANGHPEWETEIRQTFAQQWIDSAESGWFYRNASGQWEQKE